MIISASAVGSWGFSCHTLLGGSVCVAAHTHKHTHTETHMAWYAQTQEEIHKHRFRHIKSIRIYNAVACEF